MIHDHPLELLSIVLQAFWYCFLTTNQVVYLAIPKVFISLKPLFCFLSLIIASLTVFFILRVSVKSKQIQVQNLESPPDLLFT